MKFSLVPREEKFFDMFDRVGDIIGRAAAAFAGLVEHWDHKERRANELKELEHECDVVVEGILTALGRSFITPFDREDIHSLATSLDDVLDNMEETAHRLVAFRIDQPTVPAVKLSLILQKACENVERAVRLLRGRIGSEELVQALREISRLENEADEVFRTTEADLFVHPPDIMTLIKWKELYGWFENSVDACRDVAHVLNEIVVKEG